MVELRYRLGAHWMRRAARFTEPVLTLSRLESREAAEDLGIEVGSLALAVIKSTNVVVEKAPPAAAGARGRNPP